MKINLNPEMNSKIADIMRVSEQPAQMYAAALIDAYRASGLEPDEIPHLLTLTVKLLLLCEVPQEKCDKVFRRLHIGAGDYMGSGFAFVDAYHRIYDNFIETTTDGAYQAIKDEIDRQQMPQPPKEDK